MDFIGVLITLVIVGIVFYFADRFVIRPYVADPFKTLIYIVVAIIAVLWLLCALGVYCYHGVHA